MILDTGETKYTELNVEYELDFAKCEFYVPISTERIRVERMY